MKKKILALLLVMVFAFSLVACTSQKKQEQKENQNTEQADAKKLEDTAKEPEKTGLELNVSAAASLKDALTKINENYQKETGNTVTMNLASSGKLVKQIEEGAPADVFISASKAKMDELVEKDIVEKDAVSNLLNNDLVMVVPKDAEKKAKSVEEILEIDGKIAVGEPSSVPAGKYTQEALTSLGVWEKLQDKIVFAKDVRATLAYVEKGEVVAGFVYKSDATVAENSEIAVVLDEATHKPIIYPIAVIKESKNVQEAKKYEEFLKTQESLKIFEEFGFKVAK